MEQKTPVSSLAWITFKGCMKNGRILQELQCVRFNLLVRGIETCYRSYLNTTRKIDEVGQDDVTNIMTLLIGKFANF